MKRLSLVFVVLGLAACASKPVLMTEKDIKVSRDEASKKCKELGTITGRTASATGTREQALEDLKREAANKGANYVMIKEMSSYGTAVTGIAYDCP